MNKQRRKEIEKVCDRFAVVDNQIGEHAEELKSIYEELERAERLEEFVVKLLTRDPLPEELSEWAKDQYNKYFYTKTMSTKYQ